MGDKKREHHLTGALEDYLETIFELVRDHKVARVKEIAKARGVKSGSVSPAMRRLDDLGLIKYVEREYIDLTPAGEAQARRIYAKHQLLTRFFQEILRMPSKEAEADACAMEHNLSDAGMDAFVKFFEFLQGCPEGTEVLDRFGKCSLVHDNVPPCEIDCALKSDGSQLRGKPLAALWDLAPGQQARVCQIADAAGIRQRLLDMGIMPDVLIEVDKKLYSQEQVWITFEGFQVCLTREQAESVTVRSI